MYYLLRYMKPNFINIAKDKQTTGLGHVTKGDLQEIEVKIPDKITQRRIAAILTALDDKIELNRRMNQTLEGIAQAIFREWFVRFNFPGATGEMVETELGRVPVEWRILKLGDLIDTISVTHPMKQDEIVFLNTSDILEGQVLKHEYVGVKGLPGQAKKSIKKGDILFSEIRPANKRYAYIDFDSEDYVVSTKLMVLRAKTRVHPLVIYLYLTRPETLANLQQIAETRSGTFPQITFTQIKNLPIVLPTGKLLEQFTGVIKAHYEKISANHQEIKTLSQVRDSLLPKLMQGEIKIKDA